LRSAQTVSVTSAHYRRSSSAAVIVEAIAAVSKETRATVDESYLPQSEGIVAGNTCANSETPQQSQRQVALRMFLNASTTFVTYGWVEGGLG